MGRIDIYFPDSSSREFAFKWHEEQDPPWSEIAQVIYECGYRGKEVNVYTVVTPTVDKGLLISPNRNYTPAEAYLVWDNLIFN